jgi:poly-gamma-glutamate capsule biosynthesis protein CapA/YwtB (metallophosphatase superfamily)
VIGIAAGLLSFTTPARSQSAVTITLTGQSMIRSDLRATAPMAVPRIQALLKGDVIFTNLEGTVAEAGQSAQEGRGFLTPPESLDALHALGFNLLSLSDNHAFDLKGTGIENTLREINRRNIVHAGT